MNRKTKTTAASMLGIVLATGSMGCAPQLIQQIDVRDREVFFVSSHGTKYRLGDCQRAEDGTLTECQMYEVKFK